ncbi:hypothetical protein Len3610_12615 [Lentibacillus sp. CBA3610]|nr:hypothetical protein Len3610_12615 [Lentibacillus sp. CBA3610]
MEDAFKGKAANSIRAFYQESHMPFLVFMEGFIRDFQDALAKIKNSLASLESDEQGYIRESFLQEDVKQGLKNAENVTMTLTDEANHVISAVRDIVPLPSVDDSDFLDRSQQARKKTDHTLEKLYTFDSESTRALDKPQNDLDLMQTYINKLGGMVSSGDISIGNYSVQQLSQHDFHQALISGVRGKAVQNMLSLDVLIGKGAANLLSRYVPYSGAWINKLAEKFEMRTTEYSFRALNVVTASVGSDISEQEFATVKGQVVNTEKVSDYKNEWYGNYHTLMDGRIIREFMDNEGNVNYKFVSEIPESRLKPEEEEKNAFQKSVGAFKEIGLDIWSGLEERGQKATDSWYDFGNYLTLGAFDLAKNTHSGLQYNAENMLNSPSDFANWLTMGGVDMVNGAVSPDEAFSKEHWTSSFGLFLTGVGARGISAPKNAGMPKTNSKVTSPDQKSTVSAAQATSATRKLPTLTNIREWYRVNVPEMGLVQDSMGGYHFAVKKGDGGNRVESGGSSKLTDYQTYKHLKDYKNNKYFTKSVEYNAGIDGTGFTYKVYQRGDIDWSLVRTSGAKKGRGLTNAEASSKYGLAPILDDLGNIATLHHSQQKGMGPLFEASTRYHNISNAKRPPLHPYKGKLNPYSPMDETTRGAFQKIDSIKYWKIRGNRELGGK